MLPVDPELLMQRTGYACMDESQYPFNSVDSEEADYFYDDTAVVEKSLGPANYHHTRQATQSCVDAVSAHVGAVDVAVRYERLAWDPELAEDYRSARSPAVRPTSRSMRRTSRRAGSPTATSTARAAPAARCRRTPSAGLAGGGCSSSPRRTRTSATPTSPSVQSTTSRTGRRATSTSIGCSSSAPATTTITSGTTDRWASKARAARSTPSRDSACSGENRSRTARSARCTSPTATAPTRAIGRVGRQYQDGLPNERLDVHRPQSGTYTRSSPRTPRVCLRGRPGRCRRGAARP